MQGEVPVLPCGEVAGWGSYRRTPGNHSCSMIVWLVAADPLIEGENSAAEILTISLLLISLVCPTLVLNNNKLRREEGVLLLKKINP